MEKIRTEKERTQGNSPAGSLEGNKADMTKNEAPISKTNETEQGAPKKKKIVMITNPENSRMPGITEHRTDRHAVRDIVLKAEDARTEIGPKTVQEQTIAAVTIAVAMI